MQAKFSPALGSYFKAVAGRPAIQDPTNKDFDFFDEGPFGLEEIRVLTAKLPNDLKSLAFHDKTFTVEMMKELVEHGFPRWKETIKSFAFHGKVW